MPDPTADEGYNSPQINIPPTFPFILKQYAKAAIRTQPYDLLRWSASYFRALAKGEEPPIKDRLEYPPPNTPSGLSPGYLKVLIKQIGKGGTVTVNQLMERWNGICLAEEPLQQMLAVGKFGETLDWLHFVAVAAGFISNNLTSTMVLLCNLLTDEPDGGSAMIPLQIFTKMYTFLASLDCGDPEDYDDANQHEYILAEGLKDHSSMYLPSSAPLTRERVKSSSTDPSIYEIYLGSESTHQLFMEKSNSFPSPQISPPSTPPLETENYSFVKFPPQNCQMSKIKEDKGQFHKADEDACLGTYCDADLKESHHSSQLSIVDGNKLEETRAHQKISDSTSINGETSNSHQQSIVSETGLKSNVSTDITHSTLKCTSSPSDSTNVNENETLTKVSSRGSSGKDTHSQDGITSHRRHVPGIGPVVDSAQVQAVMDYLEGVGLKQEGMVKPSNIRHFLCPPLEKVPASQKTRV